MMAPASATYQQPVPIPPMAPLRMRYYIYGQPFVLNKVWILYPLVTELAIAVICGTLNWEGHRANHQSPLDSDLVHDRASHEAG